MTGEGGCSVSPDRGRNAKEADRAAISSRVQSDKRYLSVVRDWVPWLAHRRESRTVAAAVAAQRYLDQVIALQLLFRGHHRVSPCGV